jgi:hypothetical protein
MIEREVYLAAALSCQIWTDFTQEALLMLDNFTLARELKTFRGRRQELTASTASRTKRREALSMPPSSEEEPSHPNANRGMNTLPLDAEEEPSHPNANRGMNTLPLDAQSGIKKQLRTA